MCRVQAVWSGFIGGPGVNTFYVLGDDVDPGAFQAFYEGVKGSLPDDVSVLVENGGPVIEDTTGELVGGWSHSPQTPANGTNAAGYTGGAGAVLRLDTGAFRRGRRVLGRAFLVPIAGPSFAGDGRLSTGFSAGVVSLGETLRSAFSDDWVVWHRPTTEDAGEAIPVASVQVPLRAGVLRSRRD